MKKPLILAHRGARREAPENTLAAFSKAKEIGADGVELDIRLSKDQQIVVTHDEKLEKFAGIKNKVSNLMLQDLRKLDFGSHFSSQFKGEKIPTLAEVFDLLRGNMLINVEIKGKNIFGDGREEILTKLILDMKMEDQVWVSSFNIFALHRMMKMAPHIKRGYLFYEKQDFFSKKGSWDFFVKPQSWNISRTLIQNTTIDQIHQKGRECWIWTVNEEKEVEKFSQAGADVIITDEPRKFLSLFKKLIQQQTPTT